MFTVVNCGINSDTSLQQYVRIIFSLIEEKDNLMKLSCYVCVFCIMGFSYNF
jgi:hypothetical protein